MATERIKRTKANAADRATIRAGRQAAEENISTGGTGQVARPGVDESAARANLDQDLGKLNAIENAGKRAVDAADRAAAAHEKGVAERKALVRKARLGEGDTPGKIAREIGTDAPVSGWVPRGGSGTSNAAVQAHLGVASDFSSKFIQASASGDSKNAWEAKKGFWNHVKSKLGGKAPRDMDVPCSTPACTKANHGVANCSDIGDACNTPSVNVQRPRG